MNMKSGITTDGYNTQVRYYESYRQIRGKICDKIYHVEFRNYPKETRWTEYYKGEDESLALSEFEALTQ